MKVQVYSKDTFQPTTFEDVQEITSDGHRYSGGSSFGDAHGLARRTLLINTDHAFAVVIERTADELAALEPVPATAPTETAPTTDGATDGAFPPLTPPALAETPPGTVA